MKFAAAFVIWLAVVPCAVANGTLREIIAEPLLGSAVAQPLSGVILCALIFAVACLFIPKIGKNAPATYVLIGLMWFALTNLFDLSMIVFSGRPLSDFFTMFDVTTGNLWVLVLAACLVSPVLAAKRKNLIEKKGG